MSTIKIEFESEDNAVVTAVAALTNSLLGLRAEKSTGKPVEQINVVDAEEVTAEKPAPKPRPSRAKVKAPEPVVEEETEDEDGDIDDNGFDDDLDGDDESAISIDDIRAKQAEKIDKHREALKAQYKKLGATGLSSLAPENYQAMFDFLAKLK